MARTVIYLKYRSFEGLQDRISNLLLSSRYKYIMEKNEYVWKCGIGFWTAMKYIKIEFAENNTLVISGWVRPVLGRERSLDGVFGSIPINQVKDVIGKISLLVSSN